MDTLLQSISYYKRKDPTTTEEEECLENLFDTLCNCMLVPENQTRFRKSEGLDLMLRLVGGDLYWWMVVVVVVLSVHYIGCVMDDGWCSDINYHDGDDDNRFSKAWPYTCHLLMMMNGVMAGV